MELDEVKKGVEEIKWFHSIALGDGIVTPGALGNTAKRVPGLHLPEDLSGMSVLDIGAWDGFFSFEAERRGAARVLATDSFCWSGPGWGTQAGFNFARRVLNSKVEDMEIDVMDLSPERVDTFDLVMFLGVLYHLRHPLLALERIFSVTKGMLVLDTHADMYWQRRPVMAFYPGAELVGDSTNWCGPNAACIDAMLRTVGFSRVQRVTDLPSLPGRVARAVKKRIKSKTPFWNALQQNREVFHAWR